MLSGQAAREGLLPESIGMGKNARDDARDQCPSMYHMVVLSSPPEGLEDL